MTPFQKILTDQYEGVQGSYRELFRFCSTISSHHFVQPIENFGHSNIRNLFAHIANSSLFWLVEYPRQEPPAYAKPELLQTLDHVRPLFDQVDAAMHEFIAAFPDPDQSITAWVKWAKKDMTISPTRLFTHVITHMFHHKGQILSMSRQLGYTPVDTDVVRF